MPYIDFLNSTYLDLTSYRTNGSLPTGGTPAAPMTFNVALVLDRAHDPSTLLAADWGTRQQQLAAMDPTTLWSTYGADPAKYAAALSALHTLGIHTVDHVSPVNGYISSVESRTIWVQVNETTFTTLFGPTAQLLQTTVGGSTLTYWEGGLSLPDTLVAAGVQGVMFDNGALTTPVLADPGTGTAVTLPQGTQSPGNSTPSSTGSMTLPGRSMGSRQARQAMRRRLAREPMRLRRVQPRSRGPDMESMAKRHSSASTQAI